jgi:hypothetical protein
MPQHEIAKILNFSNLFQHHLPFYYKTMLKLALDSHNRPSLTFSTPKCYKILQGVMLQLQYEYYAIFWKISPMQEGIEI